MSDRQAERDAEIKARAAELASPEKSTADLPEWNTLHEPPVRRPPAKERPSTTIRFAVGGMKGYLTIGFYDESKRQPCEIFIKLGKTGTLAQGFADAWATAISIMIQHGIPLRDALIKHVGARFEPNGVVEGGGMASSIPDYIARLMLDRFVPDWRTGKMEPDGSVPNGAI